MWRHYDHDQIDRELSYVAGIGVNRGLFFPDGSIRELDPLLEFQKLAQRQGVTATRRYPIQPTLLPNIKASPDQLVQYIQHWNDRTWTKENSVGREHILRWMLVSLAWGQFLDGRAADLQQQQASFATALKAGDPARAEEILAEMAETATKQLALHHLIKKEKSFDDFSWIHGADFTPSFAATDVEFWLKYDRQVVDRELGFARQMGLNCVRRTASCFIGSANSNKQFHSKARSVRYVK